ncbi:hypothetical protein ACFOON_04660 [Novosphingobium piscinae]|uniref:Uncharacterized protein n=1 Tax=Novosphingobium piscinae TaxID=1507448 RepID=A0A7X1KP14_9SPHN|nr:hypothetical protein [Novosphingobium piscinae]MBC2668261.1 hypothetical protein [Novosphingobium piscinae]
MIHERTRGRGLAAATLVGLLLLAGCGPEAPPPAPLPPPPPPPVAVVIPPRPTPPNGASPNLVVPPVDAAGLRYSVNRNITPAQTVWNLRSAYNVAALNCRAADHAEIVPNYRAFLKAHDKGLAKANKTIDAEFKGKYGSGFVVPRERYMTEVYNHFALPPTMADFCTAVLAVSRDALLIKPAELEGFAQRSLPAIEVVFDDFFRRYDAYRTELAGWTTKYGATASAAAASTSGPAAQ